MLELAGPTKRYTPDRPVVTHLAARWRGGANRGEAGQVPDSQTVTAVADHPMNCACY